MSKTKLIQLMMILLIVLLITSCGGGMKISESSKNKSSSITFPKSTTGIIGTVISINQEKLSQDTNSPCSEVPCWAMIKVNSILGIGHGGPFFSVGDTLETNFAFTLSESTKELIPNLEKRLPGLAIGEMFSANIKEFENQSFNKKKLERYSINFYSKKWRCYWNLFSMKNSLQEPDSKPTISFSNKTISWWGNYEI